ncbi:probable E3 SUMO-protein ligase RNF212 isoform X2 [Aplysia californica]|uniref:Probable E3 SUMO-protein ligase RNF212 isoform X2 n=1 Tax=Aplysia californica TaxID=6500 RepID=A0ABM1VY28_APLCA|nr:probable E3 SUMO-protein ligase RNF212 isoform X2 [Aplysia californica]
MVVLDISQPSLPSPISSMAQQWLHCNSCFCQPDKGGVRFYLTNCSHIYCEKCVNACTKERCKLCRTQCTTLLLAGKMPKEVESMFSEPVDALQKFFKQFTQINDFQRSHQRRLWRHLREKMKFYDGQIAEAKKLLSQAKAVEREFTKVKAENEYFKTLISKKDGHQRINSRSRASPGPYSVSPSPFSPFLRNQGQRSVQPPGCSGGYNILNQPGRLLVRTPPSGGRLGSVGTSDLTPCSNGTPFKGKKVSKAFIHG